MKEFLLSLLDWIYKKQCYFCRRSHEAVKMCAECYLSLDHLPAKPDRIVEGKKIYCCGVYSKNLQKLIRGLKYHNQRDLAYYLAKFMYEYEIESQERKKELSCLDSLTSTFISSFIVVPVPLHPNRQRQRKYNHMDLVGEELCKLTGWTLNTTLIARIKDTVAQYRLTKKERMVNLHSAFQINPSEYRGGTILLIDDICTTGATFEEIIREFKKHGIDDIVCLAATTPFNS
jgi:ComF family protein